MSKKNIIGIMIITIIIFGFQLNKFFHNENNIINKLKNETIFFEGNTHTMDNKSNNESEKDFHQENKSIDEEEKYLTSTSDINLSDVDGNSNNFLFTYKNETFSASYSYDNWHIINSYKINNATDIYIICQALIEIHPIHGSDLTSFRTAEDMAYEWLQHNLAYEVLSEDSYWKNHAKDVDLNPEDQGKNLLDMYKSRISK